MPFGGLEFEDNLAENKKLFTGKELQDSRVGNDILRLYNFGARYYDPTVARWTSIDPFAEMYYSRSPYNYALNNPINLIDPNGLFAQLPYGRTITDPRGFYIDEVIVGSRTHAPKTSPFNYSSGYLSHSYNSPYGTAAGNMMAMINESNGPKAVPMYLIERLPEDRYVGVEPQDRTLSNLETGLDIISGSMMRSKTTFRLTDSKGRLDFKAYGNGWKGNQWVTPTKLSSLGMGLRLGSNILGGYNMYNNATTLFDPNASRFEKGLAGTDMAFGGMGIVSGWVGGTAGSMLGAASLGYTFVGFPIFWGTFKYNAPRIFELQMQGSYHPKMFMDY